MQLEKGVSKVLAILSAPVNSYEYRESTNWKKKL